MKQMVSSLIPDKFRTPITDRFISSFFAGKGDVMIQAELLFTSTIDAEVLRKAFRMALDAEPVLGCKLTLQNDVPVWKRLDKNDLENFTLFTSEADYTDYLNTTLDVRTGPALRGALFKSPHDDRVLFKVAHEASDAAGVKEIMALVSFLYRQLTKSPGFTAAPNSTSYRSARQLARWIPKRALLRIWYNALREILPLVLRRRACNPMTDSCNVDNRKYLIHTIGYDSALAIIDAGKRYGATVNDMFLAAFLRTLYTTSKVDNGYLRCAMTVDLRKWYLPGGKADTIANLSNAEIFDIGKNPGKQFSDTLKRVVSYTSWRKKNWIGLNMHTGVLNLLRGWPYSRMINYFEKRRNIDIKDRAIFPVMTNFGEIDKKRVQFDLVPKAAHIIVPAAFPPYFGMGISGFDGALTITTAFFPDSEVVVKSFIDQMLQELRSCNV